ncbi:MAG: protein translocase subunit SecD [Victivallaceae bacterium]
MMNRKKNIFLISCVLAFAFYHTLPTVFYYIRPLKNKIGFGESRGIITSVVNKVNGKKSDSLKRIKATLKYLKIKPTRVSLLEDERYEIVFSKKTEAEKFAKMLYYGERAIPSRAERLCLDNLLSNEGGGFAVRISCSLVAPVIEENFSFVSLEENAGRSDYVSQKVAELVDVVCRKNRKSNCCGYYFDSKTLTVNDIVQTATSILDYKKIFVKNFPQALGFLFDSSEHVSAFVNKAHKMLVEGVLTKDKSGEQKLRDALEILTRVRPVFHNYVPNLLSKKILLGDSHPLIEGIIWDSNKMHVSLLFKNIESLKSDNPDIIGLIEDFKRKEFAYIREEFGFSPEENGGDVTISFVNSSDVSGLILFNGSLFLDKYSQYVRTMLQEKWTPNTFDLTSAYFPIFSKQPESSDPFGCYVFYVSSACKHFSKGSLYVVAKGFNAILEKYFQIESFADSGNRESFYSDITGFLDFFAGMGFSSKDYGEDKVFESAVPFSIIADACGENFRFHKRSSLGTLEVSDVAGRLAAINRIESREHTELLRWRNAHRHVKYSLDEVMRLQASVPYKNVFYNNVRLATRKYFRGTKALKWGLDVSGGKTIKLAFKDLNGKTITGKHAIEQVSDELHSRFNKLGVSEIRIRREGDYINVDFPSSSDVPASDLIYASVMNFHVVNEAFSVQGKSGSNVRCFLRDVWKEARKISDKPSLRIINQVAETLLYAENAPDYIVALREQGLTLSSEKPVSGAVDDSISALVINGLDRDENDAPLIVVFKNYALDGASLFDIRTDFDAKEGNILNFSVKKSLIDKSGIKRLPTENFYDWTEKFSATGILGTEREEYSSGRGWRMAVVMDGSVISMPSLNCPLRDSARITGNFSHDEITKLAADLKAGTMSFVPEIVSEETVDPEIGKVEKLRGISAAVLGLFSVIAIMCIYYKFGGVIASGAVLLNLLMIWATLQYFEATLTLSGLSGIILAMGMAVDANVLVFERIREEYLSSGALRHSFESGYKKAFTAILDSNVTTVLAAGVLLFLDTGPVKGFALTLIIGIFSSMFTALFLTKVFFDFWLEKTEREEFGIMSRFIGLKINFLSESRKMWGISIIILLAGCVAVGCGALSSLPGIEFKGGMTFTLDVPGISMSGKSNVGTKEIVQAFSGLGYSSRDFKVRLLNESRKIKIYFSKSIFGSLSKYENVSPKNKNYDFQEIPWLVESVNVLNKAGIEISPENLNGLHLNCSGVSGAFSSKMRNQAIYGLALALIGILCYISIRFEWRYALSAVAALLHDLVITGSLLAAVHFFVKNLQFDLQAIGALITVLGYSLNNTIIIFDRIREFDRMRQADKLKCDSGSPDNLAVLINTALNGTLSRTIMTTGTTLSVLLILLFVGGETTFNFAFILTTGILIGTLSSLYIAPPLLLYINRITSRRTMLRLQEEDFLQ